MNAPKDRHPAPQRQEIAMSKPIIGLIGGTGLGQALLQEVQGRGRMVSTPFGEPSAPITDRSDVCRGVAGNR